MRLRLQLIVTFLTVKAIEMGFLSPDLRSAILWLVLNLTVSKIGGGAPNSGLRGQQDRRRSPEQKEYQSRPDRLFY